MSGSGLSEIAGASCLFFIFLVPLAAAGLSLISAGLGRSRSATHLMMSSLAAMAVASLVYFLCGFAFQGALGEGGHTLSVGGSHWDWIATRHFFLRGIGAGNTSISLVALLQMFSVGLAALIPLGSGADRWRLRAIAASTAVLAGWTYPLFAHWVWGGWLAQLGVNYGLGHGFLDPGGASTIQVVGGLTALSVTWILGPRRGKYSPDGMAPAIPGHNSILILFGCMLALVGWLGLNSAGSILFTGAAPASTILIALNTMLSASAAALTANGWVAGLVASSATCAFVVPAESIVIGSVAGAIVPLAVELFELKLEVDDPGGSVSVHAIGGLWAILALGIFARFDGPVGNVAAAAPAGDSGQLLAQLVGIATLLGFILPLTYGANWLLNRLWPFRVAPEGERQGMDLYELGAGAYPEFVTHTDEFMPR